MSMNQAVGINSWLICTYFVLYFHTTYLVTYFLVKASEDFTQKINKSW